MNQCDGCRSHQSIENGLHYIIEAGRRRSTMVCQATKYQYVHIADIHP